MGRKVCGTCGARNELNATRCAECGASLKRKRKPPAKATRKKAAEGGILLRVLDLVPGLVRTRTLIAMAGMMALAAGLGVLALAFLQYNALPATLLIGMLAMLCYCTAVIWMLYGYVCLPSEAIIEFDAARWLLLIALTVVPIAVVAALPGS